jgi:hypothetical protein
VDGLQGPGVAAALIEDLAVGAIGAVIARHGGGWEGRSSVELGKVWRERGRGRGSEKVGCGREEAGEEPSAEPLGADPHRQIDVAAQLRGEEQRGNRDESSYLGDGGWRRRKKKRR